jgi:hypothetical protein
MLFYIIVGINILAILINILVGVFELYHMTTDCIILSLLVVATDMVYCLHI